MEKKSDYECVSNEIWSKVGIVNESGDHGIIHDDSTLSHSSTFIKFDQFRRFWSIVRDKENSFGLSREVCDFCLFFSVQKKTPK